MKYIPVFISTIILSGLLFYGCDIGNADSDKNDLSAKELKAELIDKVWELRTVEAGGYGIYAPEEDSMYTLRFFEDGSFEGNDCCNKCGGEYRIDDDKNLVFLNISVLKWLVTDSSTKLVSAPGYIKAVIPLILMMNVYISV